MSALRGRPAIGVELTGRGIFHRFRAWPIYGKPNILTTCEEVADFQRIEKDALASWRETGSVDLPFVKLGLKEIRYRDGNPTAFIVKRLVANTLEVTCPVSSGHA